MGECSGGRPINAMASLFAALGIINALAIAVKCRLFLHSVPFRERCFVVDGVVTVNIRCGKSSILIQLYTCATQEKLNNGFSRVHKNF